MARKISEEIVASFLKGEPLRVKNTSTDGFRILLHGNRIAWKGDAGAVYATLAGWNTITTRERLNTLCSALGNSGNSFYQQKGKAYYKGVEVDDCENVRIL